MSITHEYSRRRSRGAGVIDSVPAASPTFWQRLIAATDPSHAAVGAEGELLVARARAILIALLLPVPVINIALDPDVTVGLVGTSAVLLALALASGVMVLLRMNFYRPWLGFVTSVLDVTIVSVALMTLVLLGQPVAATNSRLVFEFYFLAIGATALRYDARVSLSAGAAACVQYALVILLADFKYDLVAASPLSGPYGRFDWATQLSRLILLGVMTVLTMAIVYRSRELRRLSRSDRLTGLPNRSYLEERLAAEFARSRRYQEPMALAIMDVDHFKSYNDTWGHAAGDVALRNVARVLMDAVRESDVAVRYGGEEFVVLFPGMDSTTALERAERIRRRIEETVIPIPRSPDVAKVTISIGVAAYGIDGTTPDELLDAADARLFGAKESGRNRVLGPPQEARAEEPRSRPSLVFERRPEI